MSFLRVELWEKIIGKVIGWRKSPQNRKALASARSWRWLDQPAEFVRKFDYEKANARVRDYVGRSQGVSLLIAGGIGLIIGAILRHRKIKMNNKEDKMYNDKNKYETPEQETSGEPGNSGAKGAMERGAEAFGHAEQAVTDVYDKTSGKVGEIYVKVRNYSHDNPGKTILIALGIGVGLGLLLGASSGRSRTRRIA